MIHDADCLLKLSRNICLSIELNKVVVAFLHVLDLVSKLLLAPLIHICDVTAEFGHIVLCLLDSCYSYILFDLSIDNYANSYLFIVVCTSFWSLALSMARLRVISGCGMSLHALPCQERTRIK